VTTTAVVDVGALSQVEKLYRASLDIGDALDRQLRPLHLSFARWNILKALVVTGPLSIRELAGQAGVHRTTASALLKSMQARDYVRIGADCTDRRCVEVRATPAGRAAFHAGTDIIVSTNWQPLLCRLKLALQDPEAG
jgi:DNA-binding MarR family transcriptional regulator